jgi:hypothetical protein
MTTEGPPPVGTKESVPYDWDFTTPEGRSVKAYLESGITRAMQQRLAGDLTGATKTLEDCLAYARSVKASQEQRVTDDPDDEKDRVIQLHHAEELEQTLAKLVEEFKQ